MTTDCFGSASLRTPVINENSANGRVCRLAPKMDYLEAFRAINDALSICLSILYGLNQKL